MHIYICYLRFHSVNLLLQTETSIQSRHLKKRMQLETLNKMKATKRFNTKEREKNRVSKGKSLRKWNKKIASRKKLLMHHLKVILILLLKNTSSKIIHPDVVVNAVNDEVSSISSQIVEQIEGIPEKIFKKSI